MQDMQELKIEIAKIGTQMNESNRRLEAIERNIDRVVEGMAASNLKVTEISADVEDHERRISSIEEYVSWGVKIVLGVVFMAILGLVVIKGYHPPLEI